MNTSSDSPQGVKATDRQFCEWVGLNGPKPSNGDLAAYLANELENREKVDAVEYAVTREAIAALQSKDALMKALEEATEALRPFAAAMAIARDKYAARYGKHADIGYQNFDKMPGDWPMDRLKFTMAEFRRAQTAVAVLAALSTPGAE